MRLYVIGPVTGREKLNQEAFEDAKERLLDAGYDVLIPHDVVPPDAVHERAMRLSIKAMLGCDGVVVLSGWEGSKGAKLEHDVAISCGLYVRNFLAWQSGAASWAHRSPDCIEDDNLPEETPNPPSPASDGALAPSNEALGALTRRMDETNALQRAVYNQIAALITMEAGSLANSANSSVIESIADTMETALSHSRKANEYFEAAESASRADHFADTDKKAVGE